MDLSKLEDDLVSEIRLEPLHAKVYLLVTCSGQMTLGSIAEKLDITEESASRIARDLMEMGAFIDMPGDKFEAMHPRFTAVRMYRNYCLREGIPFRQNKLVDNIGAILEKPYDDARTK